MNKVIFKLRLGASGGYPDGLSVFDTKFRGLSQVFKASDWPNSNVSKGVIGESLIRPC